MKPWWQVATPHRDIRDGKFDEAVFAADLGDVAQGKGPIDYRDPETFFHKTYITIGLENLIESVLSRLAGKGKGEGVIQLQTPFGGGKTHSLVALYHLVKNREKISHFEAIKRVLSKIGLGEIPEAKIAVFDGTHLDPVKGRTPWGEIAHQFGLYELVKEHDEKRVTPGKDKLTELLSKSSPVLIIIDEFHHYVSKTMKAEAGKTEKGQALAFLRELTVTVASLKNCVLVITLPSSRLEAYDEAGEQALAQLQKISGRVEAIYTPVEGEELYEIIRKRLFEDTGGPEIARLTADEYFDLYQKLKEDIPSEAREPTYRDKIRKAYPFHPELIDVLYERWGSISTFQRTRGVLRLIAEVLADLYRKEYSSPLIQPAHIDFSNASIRREFVKHIGNEFEGVIAADITGDKGASKVDRGMGTEYARHKVATGLASSIFFYSFGGGERRGVSLQRLRLAFLREGIPPAIVGDALRRLEEALWFLHSEKSLYYFKNQPNLNRVIIDKEETIKDDEIEKEVKETIEKVAGTDFAVRLFPESSSDIPDDKNLKLAIISPDYPAGFSTTEEFLKDLATKHSTGFRTYKNTLLFLVAGSGEYEGLKSKALRFLALRGIKEDKRFVESLSEENRKTLETKLKEVSEDIPYRSLNVYRHLAKVKEGGPVFYDLGLPTVGENPLLSARVKDYLKDQELLLDKISPKYLLEKTFAEGEEKKPVKDIWEAFLKFSHLPLLENEGVLKRTIIEGVRSATLGLQVEEKIWFGGEVFETEVNDETLVVRSEVAKALKEKVEAGVAVEEAVAVGEGKKGYGETITVEPTKGVGAVKIRARIPWDKLSEFMSGVILPLQQDGAEIELEVELTAKSEKGIDKNTLELKTKETLNQIQAQILDWFEEE